MNERVSKRLSLVALCALYACALISVRAQEGLAERGGASVEHGSLAEIKNKHAALLIVDKSYAVDARAPAEISAEDVRAALETTHVRRSSAYRIIAGKLDKYARKYGSLTAVESRSEADFTIVFKIMREHPSQLDGHLLTYGKMFVLVVHDNADERPRIVWESKGEMSLAEDAAGELIRALKTMRGER